MPTVAPSRAKYVRHLLITCCIAFAGGVLFLLLLNWEWRDEIKRESVPGHAGVEVVFVRYHSLLSGTTRYVVEFPNGAHTKVWVDAQKHMVNQIREECIVEYEDQTLRILGPGDHRLEVSGYVIDTR